MTRSKLLVLLLAVCVFSSCGLLSTTPGALSPADIPTASSTEVTAALAEATPKIIDAGSNFLYTLLIVVIVASMMSRTARTAFGLTAAAALTWMGDWFRAHQDKQGRAKDRGSGTT